MSTIQTESSRNSQEGAVHCSNASIAGNRRPGRFVEDYRGYRIRQYGAVCVACLKSIDVPDFDACRRGEQVEIIANDNSTEVRRMIDARAANLPDTPLLGKGLFICQASPSRTKPILDANPFNEVTLLVPPSLKNAFPGYRTLDTSMGLDRIASICIEMKFHGIIAPFDNHLSNSPWERFAAKIGSALYALFPDGSTRLYERDHFGRVQYNMAYLRSMYSRFPNLDGKRILEIGCSDGLTCDLVARELPERVDGIDLLDTTGILYPNHRVRYHRMGAEHTAFDDNTFDAVYSIATFEHIPEPMVVLKEIVRILKPGGVAYIQAAPLYYSQYGHHMFGYFDDYPWIHVRLSKEAIIDYCRRKGIDEQIEKDKGTTVDSYIHSMINPLHVNGRRLADYELKPFIDENNVTPLHFSTNRTGQENISQEVLNETGMSPDDLTIQGFEFVFQKDVKRQ